MTDSIQEVEFEEHSFLFQNENFLLKLINDKIFLNGKETTLQDINEMLHKENVETGKIERNKRLLNEIKNLFS